MARRRVQRNRPYDRADYLRSRDRIGLDHAELRRLTATPESCWALFSEVRWPDGPYCGDCFSADIYVRPDGRKMRCRRCGYQFSVTSDTWVHKSPLAPDKLIWIPAHLLDAPYGTSAKRISRREGISPYTSWYTCHTIREAMFEDILRQPLPTGIVEVDEVHIRYGTKKFLVVGAIERGGRHARFEVIQDASKPTLHNFIRQNVAEDVREIHTDSHKSYVGIGRLMDAEHHTVNHSLREYVRGNVTTNTIESFWAALRRAMNGVYQMTNEEHAALYVAEAFWRRSHATDPDAFRNLLRALLTIPSHREVEREQRIEDRRNRAA